MNRTDEYDCVFYDGGCGLCHRSVRIAAAGDPLGSRFRFAPLGGLTFLATVPEDLRTGLPDSIVVWTADSRLLVHSEAILHLMRRLGGGKRLAAIAASLLPRSWRDAAYRFIARRRLRWFRKPETACPILPPELRERFLD